MTTGEPNKPEEKEAAVPAVVNSGGALALVDDDVFNDAGAGFEEVGKDDLAIPRLKILQQLSPQLSPKKTEYIPEAKAGEILNSLSLERFNGDKGITVVPVSFIKSYVEFIPRNKGGGMVHNYGSDARIMLEATRDEENGKMVLKNGNEVVESANYYVLLCYPDGSYKRALITLSGTQMKYSKRWITLANEQKLPRPDGKGMFTPPLFFYSYHLTLGMDSNQKGDWYTWRPQISNPTRTLPGGIEIYDAAKLFSQAIREGKIKAPEPEIVQTADGTATVVGDDEIPF